MAINLLEMVQGSLGSSVIGQIGGLLGENEKSTGSAVNSAVPAILGGLMKQSSSPAGAQEIFNNSSNFDGGMLGNLAGALGGGGHSSLIQTGTSMLGSIFGGSQSGLIGSIARMAGIGQGSAGSLLGLLVPVVMSALSKVRASDNLDAGGMANLLASQKDHVSAALPADLRNDLGLGDLLGKGSDAVRGAGDAVSGAASRTAGAATETVKSGGGLLSKLLPLVILAAIAWAVWNFFLKGETPAMPDKPAISDAATGAMGDVAGMGDKLTGSVGDLTTTIGGITDEASATASVDKLKEAASGIDGLGLDKLPDAAKGPLAGIAGPLVEKLKGVLETAYAIPGVQGILEPIVGPILETLGGLGG